MPGFRKSVLSIFFSHLTYFTEGRKDLLRGAIEEIIYQITKSFSEIRAITLEILFRKSFKS